MGTKKRAAARREKISFREGRRKEGYRLLGSGVSKAEIARKLDVDYTTVVRWENRKAKLGSDSWRDRKIPGRPPELDREQLAALKKILLKDPRARGYDSDLWTLKRVVEVIKQEFGIEYSISNAWNVLRALGFSPQVPTVRAMERDEKWIREWVENEWPKIVLYARKTNATLLFLDESCVQSQPNVHRTWAPIGSEPEIRTKQSKRDKLSLISAVSVEGELYFRLHRKDISGAEVLAFLRRLLKEIRGKVVLLWDSGTIHRTKEIKRFLYENRKRLYTRRFPTYAPELNPDEQVWNLLKDKELPNWCPTDIDEMNRRVLGGLRRLQKQPERVRSALTHAEIPLPVGGYLGRGWRGRLGK
jgi:transposase